MLKVHILTFVILALSMIDGKLTPAAAFSWQVLLSEALQFQAPLLPVCSFFYNGKISTIYIFFQVERWTWHFNGMHSEK